MTENEKKYAEAYVKLKEKRKGSLSLLDWDEMTALRKELGMTVGQCNRVTKVIESIGIIDIHPLRERGDLVLSNIKAEENDPYAALLDEIDKYSAFADEIIKNTVSLQQKTDELILQVNEYAAIAADLAVGNYNKGNKREAKALGGAAAIVGVATWLYGKYKEAELNERQEKQLAELLAKKQDYARQKLSEVQRQCTKFRESVLAKFIKLFSPELQKEINIEENTDEKLKAFKRLFLMMLKSQYLVNILEYVNGEMQAWLNGMQSSEVFRPLVAETVDDVIYSWFDKNIISRKEISDILGGAKNAKLASLFLLSEQYLLRRHVGVKLTNSAGFECDTLFASDHYSEPLILSVYNFVSDLYGDLNNYEIVENKWTKYVTESDYINKCDDEIVAAFADAPSEGKLPDKIEGRLWFWGAAITIPVIGLTGGFALIILPALGYLLYKYVSKKQEEFYPVQLQEYISDASKKVMAELNNYKTNKL